MFFLVTSIGLVFGVSFSVFLWTRTEKDRSNKVLAGYVFFLSVAIAEPLYQYLDFFIQQPIWLSLIGGLYFLAGPLLLLYTKIQCYKERILDFSRWHWMPFITYIVAVLIVDEAKNVEEGLLLDVAALELLYVHIFLYLVASLTMASRSIAKLRELDNQVNFIKISVTRFQVILSMILFGFSLTLINMSLFLSVDLNQLLLASIQWLALICIVGISFLNPNTVSFRDLRQT